MSKRTVNGTTYDVTCNWHERPLIDWTELVHVMGCEAAEAEFPYMLDALGDDAVLEEFNTRFFKYRGMWWDAENFEAARLAFANGTDSNVRMLGFDAASPQSAWDAVVLSWFDRDGDVRENAVVVGHLYWG